MEPSLSLSTDQIEQYLRDGVLVVDNFLSPAELQTAKEGLTATLRRHGVDPDNLEGTGRNLAKLSSTSGSGGVLDLFYDEWKLDIALKPRLFQWTQQLWKASFICGDDDSSTASSYTELPPDEQFKWHPYGRTSPKDQGFCYIDRICYRLPTDLSNKLGREEAAASISGPGSSSKKNKKCTLQRGLTPHLDCCPDTFDTTENKTKWRPIQCFVSLTDNISPNTGGFEVAKGFHREFRQWAQDRPPSRKGDTLVPAPCIGEYTHIRPKEDADIMKRIEHVPVKAGSVVFWDNRLPHANAYRHDGHMPRVVVYCSYLPPIDLNRQYAQRQLARWRQGLNPTDQWIGASTIIPSSDDSQSTQEKAEATFEKLSRFSRQLLAIEEW